jgi:hypothetical protein
MEAFEHVVKVFLETQGFAKWEAILGVQVIAWDQENEDQVGGL